MKLKYRRFRQKISNHKRILIMCLVGLLCFMSAGYSLMQTSLAVDGGATIVPNVQEFVCDLDIDYSVEVRQSWPGGGSKTVYNTFVNITNNSSEDIIGWNVKIKGPSDLDVSFTNANYTIDDNGVISLNDMGWNGTITSGGSFEWNVALVTVESPLEFEYFTFNGCKIAGTSGDNAPSSSSNDEPTVYNLRGMELVPSEYNMTVGETVVMQLEKDPEYVNVNPSWKSSDESIANVSSNGKVNAKKEGSVEITASYEDIITSATINITDLEENNNEESEVITKTADITFSQTGWWSTSTGYTMNYSIIIENNTDIDFNTVNFDVLVPDNSTFTTWSQNTKINNNHFTYSKKILSGGKAEIKGQATIPKKTWNIKYLTPEIINKEIN